MVEANTRRDDQEVVENSSGTWDELVCSDSSRLFLFESDLASSMRRLPLAVRRKLDRCGIHLSLMGWQRMSKVARTELLILPADSVRERSYFITRLNRLLRVTGHADELSNHSGGAHSEWRDLTKVPEAVQEELARVRPDLDLNLVRWAALSELERFALVKLSRPGHANRGFELLVAEVLESGDRERLKEIPDATAP